MNRFYPVWAVILLVAQQQVRAQHLYVFSVVEPSLAGRPDRTGDVRKLQKLTDEVARCGNYTKHWYDFGDSAAFTGQTVLKTLESFIPQSEETAIVWFHYAGQGYSDGPKAWPTLQLNGGDVPLRDILAVLRSKTARTVLVTVDTGNRPRLSSPILPTDGQTGSTNLPGSLSVIPQQTNPSQTNLPPQKNAVDAYRHLFRAANVQQLIVMASASRGQWAYRSSKQGSVWLDALINAFALVVRKQAAEQTWKHVQETVVQITQQRTRQRQTPVYNRQTITCCETETSY